MTRWTNEKIKQRHGFSRRHSLLCAVACATLFAHAATVYVAPEPTGSDETGDGSSDHPYATAAKAFTKVTTGTDDIYFASGTYYFTEAAAIPNKKVNIVGKDDRSVIFDGQNQTRIFNVASTKLEVNISGITFQNTTATENDQYANWDSFGGAIRLVHGGAGQNSQSTITNCTFKNCKSNYGGGGAIYLGGNSTIVDCTFTNCTACLAGKQNGALTYSNNPGGGAVYANTGSGDVTIQLCSFTDCVCSNGVGVVGSGFCDTSVKKPNTNACSVVVRDCGFTNNVSYGFAACLGLKARIVERCAFKGNVVKAATGISNYLMNGGGVWAPEGGVSLGCGLTNFFANCVFENNVSDASNGGGVFYTSGATFVVATNCVFAGNSSVSCGNVYYGTPNADGGLIMEDCVVTGNWSRAIGTSLYNRYGTIYQGEGDNRKDATLYIRRTLFAGNVDHGVAGVVWSPASGTEIVDCEFRGNWAKNAAVSPATVNFTSTATNSLVRGCLFAANTNNSASSSVVRFSNYNADGNGTGSIIESCTFAGNRTTGEIDQYTGAICLRSSDAEGFAIRNCVFWDNRSTNENASVRSFASTKSDITKKAASYCWEDGAQLVTGTNGNIAGGTTPGFVDAANGDYAPTKQSPFRDKGILQAWMSNARDLAKNVRVLGDAPDMGCYEFVPGVGGLSIFVR